MFPKDKMFSFSDRIFILSVWTQDLKDDKQYLVSLLITYSQRKKKLFLPFS